MTISSTTAGPMPWWTEPTKDQWMAWVAAWLGWTLDAFDFTIFLLIMVPIAETFKVCRAGGTGGTRIDRGGDRTQGTRLVANPCRRCHRIGRSRRSDRVGCCSGASGRWRNAEPCGAAARYRRAKYGGHR